MCKGHAHLCSIQLLYPIGSDVAGPCIALCMGERGQPTRMLAAKYGGYLTFGALGGGKESAPGQPTLHQLKHMYRLPDLTPNCQVCEHSTTVYFMQALDVSSCVKTYAAARWWFMLLLSHMDTSKVDSILKCVTPPQ